MASSSTAVSSESNPKPLDPAAASFQPTAANSGGHLQPLLPYGPSPSALHPSLESYGHPRLVPPPQVSFFPHAIYPPPAFYVRPFNFCYYPLRAPPAPTNHLGFDGISPSTSRIPVRERPRVRRKRKVWVPRNGGRLPSTAIEEAEAKLNGKTSLMIRNIPNQLERENLEEILDRHCYKENGKGRPQRGFCESAYDFLYLPMDFVFKLNLGFAFVNFTSPEAAALFYAKFNNLEWLVGDKKKVCEICPAFHQGKGALERRFRSSVFECDRKEYLPVIYSPPRDGLNRTRTITIGRCTGRRPARDGGTMIMTQRKRRGSGARR